MRAKNHKEYATTSPFSTRRVKKGEKRMRPTPPNFNKTPARIIDPEVGASTWARGSQ